MFRGWIELGGAELANSSRVVALAGAPGTPADDATGFSAAGCAPCRNVYVGRDDSWPGLQAWLGDTPYSDITTAPWYDGSDVSREFLGVWIMSIDGGDAIPISRDIADGIASGGVAGIHRDRFKTLNFSALVWACTNRGAVFGQNWLNCQLRAARRPQTLRYLAAHPEAGPVTGLEHTLRKVVLTDPAVIQELAGVPTGDHQQSSVYRVTFELTALDPYPWTATVAHPVTWDSEDVAGIEWAHAPDCGGATCELPELLSTQCPPAIIDTRPAPVPVCGGCIPVCELETRVWELDLSAQSDCDVVAASITITAGVEDVTAQFWWRPCGSTDDCDRVGQLQITGLPAGETVIADSIDGRGYWLDSGQRLRQRGIVGTPSGAPWRGTLLEAGCWELVAQSAPDLAFTVTVDTTGRPS